MLHIPVILGHRPKSANRRGEMWSKRSSDKEVPSQNPPRDESRHRRTRDDPSISQQYEYRDMKNFRRECSFSSHHPRDRSPCKRDAYFFRKSNVGGKDSPHSRSGCRARQSPTRSRPYSSHPSHHRKCEHAQFSYKWHSERKPKVKEPSHQSLKTSRDSHSSSSLKTSRDSHSSSSSATPSIPSSKMLDKLSRLTEKELKVTIKQTVEKPEVSDESDWPKVSEFEIGFMDHRREYESRRRVGTELVVDNQITKRLKAIASKTEEIEQAYHQDCETFGMVVKMLIEKDPSLEKPIQSALRQNLHEISEQCVTELKDFIAEYDASTQVFRESS